MLEVLRNVQINTQVYKTRHSTYKSFFSVFSFLVWGGGGGSVGRVFGCLCWGFLGFVCFCLFRLSFNCFPCIYSRLINS